MIYRTVRTIFSDTEWLINYPVTTYL